MPALRGLQHRPAPLGRSGHLRCRRSPIADGQHGAPPRKAEAIGGLSRCETLRAASERGAADTLLAARSTRRPRHRNRGKERESEAPPVVGTQLTCGGKASPIGRPGRAGQPMKLGEGSPPRILPARCTRGSQNYGDRRRYAAGSPRHSTLHILTGRKGGPQDPE